MSPLFAQGPAQAPNGPASTDPARARLATLGFGALGVVYGDIGTSPIYALRQTLGAIGPDGAAPASVVGAVSLLIWTITLIVTGKYVLLLLHADNYGEGGALALFARLRQVRRGRGLGLALAVAGAAFFFGDAVLTPAISVLSASEGIAVIEPGLAGYALPMATGMLVALFVLQRAGSGRISAGFGPVMALWFLTLAQSGLSHIADQPEILAALSPLPGIELLSSHPGVALAILGGVFLAVTGAEALYADLGHFGRAPIRLTWFLVVMPALMLNYLGQGALVLGTPETAANPFFLMVSDTMLPALVALATAATIIASQAVISGAFSLARQALLLGFLPRLTIRHTSEENPGQIYLPAINWIMMVLTLWIMAEFGSSDALASAYGLSVLGSMLTTTLLAGLYLHRVRGLGPVAAVLAIVPAVALEASFGAANLTKINDGGWVPLALASAFMLVMSAWLRGTARIQAKARRAALDIPGLLQRLGQDGKIARVEGTAIFLNPMADEAPAALLHNIKHNKVLHRRNVILTVQVHPMPRVAEADRADFAELMPDFFALTLNFGFMETPNIPRAIAAARDKGLRLDVLPTSIYLGRRRAVTTAGPGLALFLDRLYIALARLSADPVDYFSLPRDRVLEIGERIAI